MPHKTNKLSATNPVAKNHVGMRVLVGSNFGCIITNFFAKLSPGQMCIYCRAARRSLSRIWATPRRFPPKSVAWRAFGQKSDQIGAQKMGFLSVTGHTLRRLFITTLAYDPCVSVEESMLVSRHSLVATQPPYMLADDVSEAARFKALGLKN